ncbi:MAG: hypothetical protein WBW84_03840 [Acidobacteriaceae bacterium]
MEVFPVFIACRFTLDNGQPCGNFARPFSHFCRHHSPEALLRRGPKTRPLTPVTPEAERAEMSLYWRGLHNRIPEFDTEDLQDAVGNLMHGVAEHILSHRSAGRLLEAIENRRRVLEAQSLVRSVLHCADSIQANTVRNGGAPSQVLEEQALVLRGFLRNSTNASNQQT